MTMFMRKEVEYLITPFAESQLQVSDTPLPPEEDDRPFLAALRQLEVRIAAQVDYGAWEADFFAMEALCRQRYQHWLQAKGVPEPYSGEFPFCVETYLNFIYQSDAGTLREVSVEALAEFFLDYLLRKVMAKPPAQFIELCSRSKWSKYWTKSPFLALLAMAGSNAAYKIISACSNAVS